MPTCQLIKNFGMLDSYPASLSIHEKWWKPPGWTEPYRLQLFIVIQFVYGWNRYLWPLIITIEQRVCTLMIGLSRMPAAAEYQADWQIFNVIKRLLQ